MKFISRILVGFSALVLAVACGRSTPNESLESFVPETYAAKPSNFRVSLIDAPALQLSSVFVNINRMELWVVHNGTEKRVLIGKETGALDLMLLRNGVSRTIQDFELPENLVIKEIRLILEGEGNYAIKTDGSTCDLQTPSGQQSGIKIKLSEPVTVESNSTYSMVVDFDAQKSVVVKGNGGCLLKPVLKLAAFNRIGLQQVDDEGGAPDEPGEDLTDGTDDNTDDNAGSDDTGFDESDSTTWPPGYEPGAGLQ